MTETDAAERHRPRRHRHQAGAGRRGRRDRHRLARRALCRLSHAQGASPRRHPQRRRRRQGRGRDCRPRHGRGAGRGRRHRLPRQLPHRRCRGHDGPRRDQPCQRAGPRARRHRRHGLPRRGPAPPRRASRQSRSRAVRGDPPRARPGRMAPAHRADRLGLADRSCRRGPDPRHRLARRPGRRRCGDGAAGRCLRRRVQRRRRRHRRRRHLAAAGARRPRHRRHRRLGGLRAHRRRHVRLRGGHHLAPQRHRAAARRAPRRTPEVSAAGLDRHAPSPRLRGEGRGEGRRSSHTGHRGRPSP